MDDCAESKNFGSEKKSLLGERHLRAGDTLGIWPHTLPLENSLLWDSVIVSAQDFGAETKAKHQEETVVIQRFYSMMRLDWQERHEEENSSLL